MLVQHACVGWRSLTTTLQQQSCLRQNARRFCYSFTCAPEYRILTCDPFHIMGIGVSRNDIERLRASVSGQISLLEPPDKPCGAALCSRTEAVVHVSEVPDMSAMWLRHVELRHRKALCGRSTGNSPIARSAQERFLLVPLDGQSIGVRSVAVTVGGVMINIALKRRLLPPSWFGFLQHIRSSRQSLFPR